MTSWQPDPLTLAVLWAAIGLYVVGLRARPTAGRVLVGRARIVAFAVGMAALAVALVSPIDALAEEMFSVHMVQHLLLGVLAPPLLLVGKPAQVMAWGLPGSWQRRVARVHGRTLRASARAPALPLVALAGYAGTWWAWHVPVLYELAIRNELVHVLEHATMLVAGLALAAPVVRPRRVMPLLGPLLLLGAAIQGGLLGVLLTFANRPWYAVGVGGQLSPLADQQAGGALMWVFGGIVYVISAAVGLARWLQRDARTSERMDARRWKDMGYAR